MDAPSCYAVTGFGKTVPRDLAISVAQVFPQPLVKTTRYVPVLFQAGDLAKFQFWNSPGKTGFCLRRRPYSCKIVVMQITMERAALDHVKTDALVVPLFEGAREERFGASDLNDSGELTGKFGE